MPRLTRNLLPVIVLAFGAMTGCDRGDATAPASRPTVAAGDGAVSGTVKFDGPPPAPRRIEQASGQACHSGATPIFDDSVIVDPDGGLRNVVVSVENGPNVESVPATAAAGPAVLDQVNCQYVPHVLAVRAGQPVTVRSSDPTLHNVHSRTGANRSFNLAFRSAGEARTIAFAKPEASPPVEVRCDVHQWMRAHVAVFDHPFFAVTGDGGRFELTGLPAGTYTLVAWHERYGQKRQPVTVTEGGGAIPVEFRFGR
jgi:plastocyanin